MKIEKKDKHMALENRQMDKVNIKNILGNRYSNHLSSGKYFITLI